MRFVSPARLALVATVLATGVGSASAATTTPTIVVFFTQWSARLDHPADRTIATAAARAKASPDATVTVTGYADTTGGADANQFLSQTRAAVVADQLVADGVSADRITRKAVGRTPAIGGKVESRRVDIVIQ